MTEDEVRAEIRDRATQGSQTRHRCRMDELINNVVGNKAAETN